MSVIPGTHPLLGRRRERAWGLLGATGHLSYKTALTDVNLSVSAGEAIGLIGENGSGKTTMLRIIAGTTSPSAGTVRVEPPISAILELGLGFHPAFTGRENAMLYGALVGVPEETMRERLATVLEFAELGEAIDQPLRTYCLVPGIPYRSLSSGLPSPAHALPQPHGSRLSLSREP